MTPGRDFGALHYWKARILHHLSENEAAAVEAEKAVRLAPELPHPRNLLVRIYRTQGDDQKAAPHIEWLRNREHNVAIGRGR